MVYKFWKPQPPAALRACPGVYRDFFTFEEGAVNVFPPVRRHTPHLTNTCFFHVKILLVKRPDAKWQTTVVR